MCAGREIVTAKLDGHYGLARAISHGNASNLFPPLAPGGRGANRLARSKFQVSPSRHIHVTKACMVGAQQVARKGAGYDEQQKPDYRRSDRSASNRDLLRAYRIQVVVMPTFR